MGVYRYLNQIVIDQLFSMPELDLQIVMEL